MAKLTKAQRTLLVRICKTPGKASRIWDGNEQRTGSYLVSAGHAVWTRDALSYHGWSLKPTEAGRKALK